MPATRRTFHPALVRLLLAVTLLTALGGTVGVAAAPSAEAMVSTATGARAVAVVATRKGAKYKLGSVGPRRFDCSGLTQWTYDRVGKHLPRTAQGQWKASAHIKASKRRPGDLVFFFSHKHAYHVAMYAGRNKIWHAAKPGSRVKRVTLWTTKVRYGRVR